MASTASVDDAAHPPAGGRLIALDGMRGIAAVCVLMHHLGTVVGNGGALARGYQAVDFFFMLSGFVLVGVIEGGVRTDRLMLTRIARFWPLMAVGTAIGLVEHVAMEGPAIAFSFLLPALAFVPLVFPARTAFPLNAPQWSLELELLANFLHALVLRHLKTRYLVLISASCWIALAANDLSAAGLEPAMRWTGGLLRLGFAYPLGCALGRNRQLLSAFGGARWWLGPILLVLAMVLPEMLGIPVAVANPLALLAFVPILALGATAAPPAKAVKALAWLGAISFPLYAIHFQLLESGRLIAERVPASLHSIPLLGAFVLSIYLAHLLAHSPVAKGFRLPRSWRTKAA